MTILMSAQKEVESIPWLRKNIGAKPTSCDKIVIIDGITLVKTKSGKFWSPTLGNYAYVASERPWTSAMMKALVSLGAISQEAADAHEEMVKKIKARREIRYDIETIERIEKKHGSVRKLKMKAKRAEVR